MMSETKQFTVSSQGNLFVTELIVVRSALEKFFFKNFLYIIPIVYIIRGLLQYIDERIFPSAFQDFVKIPAEIALILALVFANLFFTAIPDRLYQLFSTSLMRKKNADKRSQKIFIRRFDNWLNHNFRILFGVLASLIILIYYLTRIGGFSILIYRANFSLAFLDLILYIFPTVFYAYFVGIIVWKLFITSYFIRIIPREFNVQVQFGHPDNACGLLPIGSLSLSMIYVTFIPTVLSALMLITPLIAQHTGIDNIIPNRVLLFGLSPLILLAGIIGSIVALIPIFRFHHIMIDHKLEIVDSLIKISDKIVDLKSELFNMNEGDNQKSFKEIQKRVNNLETLYKDHEHINTWPMNRRVLIKVWSTQTFLFAQAVALWNWVNQL